MKRKDATADAAKHRVVYYQTASGRQPVREFLDALRDSRKPDDIDRFDKIDAYLTLLIKDGVSVGKPVVDKLRAKFTNFDLCATA